VKVPLGASGSSQSTASSTASSGTPDHSRAGDRLSWSLAWRAGIGWGSPKEGLRSSMPAMSAQLAVGRLDELIEPHATAFQPDASYRSSNALPIRQLPKPQRPTHVRTKECRPSRSCWPTRCSGELAQQARSNPPLRTHTNHHARTTCFDEVPCYARVRGALVGI